MIKIRNEIKALSEFLISGYFCMIIFSTSSESCSITDSQKIIKGKETKVQMIKIEGKSNKSGEAISLCHVALILFDLTNRQSFENILDNCILWLRDTCGFDRKILLIGFRPNDHPKVVKEKEISDLIEISSIQATYFDFSSADEDRKIALLDDTFYSDTPQNLANESNSTKNCNIF